MASRLCHSVQHKASCDHLCSSALSQ